MFGLFLLVGGALYLAFSFWVALRVTKPIASVLVRGVSLVAIFAMVAVLPVVDGIWGNINLKRLCAAESKTEIFGKLKVPSQLLEINNERAYLDPFGNVDWSKLAAYVKVISKSEENFTGISRLTRARWSLLRESDGAVLATETNFYYRGGWLSVNGDGIGAGRCLSMPPLDAVFMKIAVPQI